MIKIAITGNIASGKSQVEKLLMSFNFKVIDSDKINNELLTGNKEVINEIKSEFGEEVFEKSGEISKPKLAEIVFNSPGKKQKLENILHKRIFEKINEFFEEYKNEKFVFVSVPLLFETNWQNNFDKIIFVSSDEQTRLERLIKRNNLTKEQAQKRIQAQGNEKDKIKQSDYVIFNNSDITALEKAVKEIIEKL